MEAHPTAATAPFFMSDLPLGSATSPGSASLGRRLREARIVAPHIPAGLDVGVSGLPFASMFRALTGGHTRGTHVLPKKDPNRITRTDTAHPRRQSSRQHSRWRFPARAPHHFYQEWRLERGEHVIRQQAWIRIEMAGARQVSGRNRARDGLRLACSPVSAMPRNCARCPQALGRMESTARGQGCHAEPEEDEPANRDAPAATRGT